MTENQKPEDLKAEFFNDMQKLNQDKAVCLRCSGQMFKLPAYEAKSNISKAIDTFACTSCGHIDNYFDPEALRTLLATENYGNN